MGVELRWLGPGDEDELVAAGDLFDEATRPEWARRFLTSPGHHLCLAVEDGRPAGFVSGVEMVHPDKGVEMFLYELGVDDDLQRRGIGTALVTALAGRAAELGCYGMWVLADADNEAGVRTYLAGGATDQDDQTMLGWRIDPGHQTFAPTESGGA